MAVYVRQGIEYWPKEPIEYGVADYWLLPPDPLTRTVVMEGIVCVARNLIGPDG